MSQSPPLGISTADAKALLLSVGANALPEPEKASLWAQFLNQFRSPLIYILLFALAFDAANWGYEGFEGVPTECITILVILIFNAALGLWQEGKSEAALAKLSDMAAPQSWVFRDGQLVRVASFELVPGDVVRVEAGGRIPADGEITQQNSFSVDESVLTGESLPVEKSISEPVYSGTLAGRGSAIFTVTATGPQSTMGKLANLLQSVESQATPLQRKLDIFGRKVAVVVLILALVVLSSGIFALGLSHFSSIFLFAVALAVAAVPESLPAVLTLAMALGVERMAKRKAVVRKLTAVEALGSVTVIATDKTGTLTENQMRVADIDVVDQERALLAMALVNDADPVADVGDPLETGLYHYVKEQQADPVEMRASYPRISEKPFDSRWKFMRVTVRQEGEQSQSFFKGAPEVIMGLCKMTSAEQQHWIDKIEAHAREGYRALALACSQGEAETGLDWLGLVLLWDPPRQEIPAAIQGALSAGIRVLMITGDHPSTALTIARGVGIQSEIALTGVQIDAANDDQLAEYLTKSNVFARVSPEHKLRIVQLLKQQGEIVAVTGDGVNDAPALKAADVGVAMGNRGSDVSREVADLVLLDDNFATMVSAIEEGRSIYENIQKFIRTLFSTNLSEVFLITIGAFIAFSLGLVDGRLLLPLTAAQILWVNLLTDSLPALALTSDRNPGVMNIPPRNPKTPLLDRLTLRFVVGVGMLGGLVALSLMQIMPKFGFVYGEVQATVFCYIVWVQLSFVLPARRAKIVGVFNPFVWGAILLASIAQLSLFFIPVLQQWLGISNLSISAVIVLVVSLAASYGLAEVITWGLKKTLQEQA